MLMCHEFSEMSSAIFSKTWFGRQQVSVVIADDHVPCLVICRHIVTRFEYVYGAYIENIKLCVSLSHTPCIQDVSPPYLCMVSVLATPINRVFVSLPCFPECVTFNAVQIAVYHILGALFLRSNPWLHVASQGPASLSLWPSLLWQLLRNWWGKILGQLSVDTND